MIWMLGALFCSCSIAEQMLCGYSHSCWDHTFLECFIGTIIWGLFSAAATLPWVGLAFLTGSGFNRKQREISRRELVALRIKDGTQGQFFLGCGTLAGKVRYFFYEKQDDEGCTPQDWPADGSVRVYEEDRTRAMAIKYTTEFCWEWAYLFGFPPDLDEPRIKFYVPRGAIKTGYEV